MDLTAAGPFFGSGSMNIFAFMLKRFVWKTKVCHPYMENKLSIAWHYALASDHPQP